MSNLGAFITSGGTNKRLPLMRLPAVGAVAVGRVLKKGPWSPLEDQMLLDYVNKYGEGNWNLVQKHTELNRCGKSCRLRWTNHLRPDLKRGSISEKEKRIILELHAKVGNSWARMASELPGRTDNAIKNYWNARKKRKNRQGLPIYPYGVQPVAASAIPNYNRYHFSPPLPPRPVQPPEYQTSNNAPITFFNNAIIFSQNNNCLQFNQSNSLSSETIYDIPDDDPQYSSSLSSLNSNIQTLITPPMDNYNHIPPQTLITPSMDNYNHIPPQTLITTSMDNYNYIPPQTLITPSMDNYNHIPPQTLITPTMDNYNHIPPQTLITPTMDNYNHIPPQTLITPSTLSWDQLISNSFDPNLSGYNTSLLNNMGDHEYHNYPTNSDHTMRQQFTSNIDNFDYNHGVVENNNNLLLDQPPNSFSDVNNVHMNYAVDSYTGDNYQVEENLVQSNFGNIGGGGIDEVQWTELSSSHSSTGLMLNDEYPPPLPEMMINSMEDINNNIQSFTNNFPSEIAPLIHDSWNPSLIDHQALITSSNDGGSSISSDIISNYSTTINQLDDNMMMNMIPDHFAAAAPILPGVDDMGSWVQREYDYVYNMPDGVLVSDTIFA